MESGQHLPIEEMELFRRYVTVADWAWEAVSNWPPLARDTVGKQLVRACDSIGANLVEGDGRFSDADALHFFVVARASARETRYWLQRAVIRGLLCPAEGDRQIAEITGATKQLNRLIAHRRNKRRADRVAEVGTTYDTTPDDPWRAQVNEDVA